MAISDNGVLERLQFFNGQRLFAADLQGQEAFNREMRWLHNKSLHQPGIGNGFAVAGERDDREVVVGAGYAIDDEGREIVLTMTHTEPVPPVAGDVQGGPVYFDLTVAYPDDDALEEAETRAGICKPRGVVRLREAPLFCWVELDSSDNFKAKDAKLREDVNVGRKIVIARIAVQNCQLYSKVALTQRRNARPASQPYIACGKAAPTAWQVEDKQAEPGSSIYISINNSPMLLPLVLTAEIDTSSAGFVSRPCYSAQILGPRVWEIPSDGGGGTVMSIIIDGQLQIIPDADTPQAGADFCRVEVLVVVQVLSDNTGYGGSLEPTSETFSPWVVSWMGVEG